MKYQKHYYPESAYGGFTDIDGTIHFYLRVNSLLDKTSIVLDVGCGRGAYQDDECDVRRNLRILKNKCHKVIGIDVDENASRNPYLDEFRLLDSSRWPLEDASVNVVVCDCVLEHVQRPEEFFAECKRVLKPNGYLCLRTANLLGYAALMAKLIPNSLHSYLIRKVQTGRKDEDVFPTHYRCNTIWKLRRHLKKAYFEGSVYGYEAEPSYLEFSKLAYWLGVLHQKYAPKAFKLALFGFVRKCT